MRFIQNIEELNSICPRAFEFIKQYEDGIEPGVYELGDGIRANVDSYRSKNRSECSYESHKKYVDIQCILQGSEIIAVAEAQKLDINIEYDSNRDIIFYKPYQGGIDYRLEIGNAIVLLPEDAHMPCISCDKDDSKQMLKIVFKIPIDRCIADSFRLK